ncbi:MAG TPA: hypothetical protein PKC98_03910, partial [Candidatus Melainabacteria bacterium]|nr:hypothetical protein [Candidatus Melainabacteria bacterium]
NPESITEIDRKTGTEINWTSSKDSKGNAVWTNGQETFKGNVSLDVKTGNSTWQRLDNQGFTESVVNRNNQGQVNFVTDKQGVTTSFGYDAEGNTNSILRNDFGWDSYLIKGEDGKWRNPIDQANPFNWGKDTGKAFDHMVLANGDQIITPTSTTGEGADGKQPASTIIEANGNQKTSNGDGSVSYKYAKWTSSKTAPSR